MSVKILLVLCYINTKFISLYGWMYVILQLKYFVYISTNKLTP